MPVSRDFSFTVNPALMCGDPVTLTWTIVDGATNYPNATKMYTTGVFNVSLAENFDGVVAPALPAGWVNTQTSGTGINWTTSTTTPSSAPNAAFANDPNSVNAAALVSPATLISSSAAQLTFKNMYLTESTFDGTVLEFSTDGGGTWTDILTGGGTFASGGYNATISANFMSPIAGRMAWSGTSTGYVDTVVNLPASLNGQMVSFRWLMASDSSVNATGQWVDDVQVLGARVCQTCTGPTPSPTATATATATATSSGSPSPSPTCMPGGQLTTLFAGGNSGSAGGAVYYDVTVGGNPISITSFDVNTASTLPFTNVTVWVLPGMTSVGNETNMGLWTQVATGSGTGAGVGLPTHVTLSSPIALSAGTLNGIALLADSSFGFTYTNGTGANQNYSDGNLSLALGSASNAPFTAPVFTPRVWNGTVYYDVAGSCGTPSPTATATATATSTGSPSPSPTCSPTNVINDGGFEAGGVPSTTWNDPQTSTNFGTPICDMATCGTGGGAFTAANRQYLGMVWRHWCTRDGNTGTNRGHTGRHGRTSLLDAHRYGHNTFRRCS